MDLKTMFPNVSGTWIRWSDYEIKQFSGVDYIMPTASATSVQYSCTDAPEQMVADALNIGKLVFERKDANEACLAFSRQYGPLGVMPPGTGPLLQEGPYADNSGKNVAPCYNGIFTQVYGEPLNHYLEGMRFIYIHFFAVNGGKLSSMDQDLLDASLKNPIACGMDYRLTVGEHPQLIWQPDNLRAILSLAYSLAVTGSDSLLKVCKNCGKVYCNTHARSEFCSTRCRNHYNVKAFRGREKIREDVE